MPSVSSLNPVIDFVFPPRCPVCGEGISAQAGLCASCWSELVIPGKPGCDSCGRPFGDAIGGREICEPCRALPPSHDGIFAATIYNDTSRKLVLSFKHGNRIALGPMMARLMAAKLEQVDRDWVAIPVPLHRWRLWSRGYNQAAVLAREISYASGARLCVDGLVRVRATPSLGGLGAGQRGFALANAIAANRQRSGLLSGANVLLVDDVLTSGATTDACIAALKKAGARKVAISCFARVLDDALASD